MNKNWTRGGKKLGGKKSGRKDNSRSVLKNEGTGPENSSRKSQQGGLKGTRSSLYQTH
jgi:hypothetical protein